MSSTLTVWYNTKCPVCNAGIEWQHRRLVRAARAGVIEFRDINLEPDVLSRFGAGVEDVRRRLHAVDAEGRLHVGADCAIAIWLRTPGDVWLGRVLSLPVLHQIARRSPPLSRVSPPCRHGVRREPGAATRPVVAYQTRRNRACPCSTAMS
jgi:predicted DCC family thiol-disulfide oxidoreductase YuxK